MFARPEFRGVRTADSGNFVHATKKRNERRSKRMLLVDDHDLFRQVLAVVLEYHTDFDRNAQADSPAEARRVLDHPEDPVDLAFVDLDLPDASVLIGELCMAGVPVLAVTESQDPERCARAVEAGAREVLTTAAPVQEIISAVQRLGGEW